MRVGVGDDVHARRLQPGDRVGRRRLHEVHLAAQQCGGPRAGFRHRQQHQAVLLRHARLVPVVGVGHQLEPFMRDHAVELVGAGAGGVVGIGGPVVFQRLRPALARHDDEAHFVGEQRTRDLGGDCHGLGVDLFGVGEVGQVGARQGELLRVPLRRLFVEAAEVPHDGVGVEGAAVMELHAVAQGEQPTLVVLGVDVPLGGEAGLDGGGLIGAAEVPVDERVVQAEADEAESLEALVGGAAGGGDVARGHGDGEDALCPGCCGGQQQCGGGQDGGERKLGHRVSPGRDRP